MPPPTPGAKAPAFTVEDQHGTKVKPSHFEVARCWTSSTHRRVDARSQLAFAGRLPGSPPAEQMLAIV